MARSLRVGILGAGEAGSGHGWAFARMPGVRVEALWSRRRARARGLASELHLPKIRIHRSWQSLVEDRDLDVISVATPTPWHRGPFLRALDVGHHVLVEYPLADNLRDASAMLRAAERAETVTAVCLSWRYVPAVEAIWQEVRKGHIGRVRDVRTEYRYRRLTSRYYTERGDKTEARGELHVASLEFDKVRLLTGSEIARIVSVTVPYSPPKSKGFTVWDGSNLHLLEMSNATSAAVRVTATPGEYEWSVVVTGDEGTLSGGESGPTTRQTFREDRPARIRAPAGSRLSRHIDLDVYVWYRLFRDFVHAVRRNDLAHATVPYLPSIQDGVRVLEATLAAKRSAKEKRWVDVGRTSA